MPPDPLRPGERVSGYRIERELGHGATGVVYLARQEALDRPVALKVVGPPFSDDPDVRERFRREARSAAALDHPNVVTVLDSGEDADRLWVAMRLVDGPDLRVLLRRTGHLEPEQAVTIVEQVAAALDAAHAAGLVHRDVKPGNILVEDGPGRTLHVELADFGLVVLAGEADTVDRDRASDPEGTPGYAAPEQWAGAEATPAADVFALGLVLDELLTGSRPEVGGSRDEDHDAGAVRGGAEFPGPAFDAVVGRATDPDPTARYASAGALAVAARVALGAERPLAERAPAGALPTRAEALGDRTTLVASPRRRRRWPWAVSSSVLLVGLIAAVLVLGRVGSDDFSFFRIGAAQVSESEPARAAAREARARREQRAAAASARARTASGARPSSGDDRQPSAGVDDAANRSVPSAPVAAADATAGSTGASESDGAMVDSEPQVPRVPASGPGRAAARAWSPPASDETRFGGGTWVLDLPTAERWRQTAVQEREGGRLLLTRLQRTDGARVIVEHRPEQTAVFGPWPGDPFVVRIPGAGRFDGLVFVGGRFAVCQSGPCAAVPVNGASGGVLLIAGFGSPMEAVGRDDAGSAADGASATGPDRAPAAVRSLLRRVAAGLRVS